MCTWNAETTAKFGREKWFPFEVWKELIDQYQPAPTFFQDHYLLPPEKIKELQNQKLAH